jgi:maltose alpha-D-glucosyltransferase/alpha-amylase
MSIADHELGILKISAGTSWRKDEQTKRALETRFLPAYLARARWFPRGRGEIRVRLAALMPLAAEDDSIVLAFIETSDNSRYVLPLEIDWSDEARAGPPKFIIAELRRDDRNGALRDVATDPAFIKRLLDSLRRGSEIATSGWRLEFRPTSQLSSEPAAPPQRVRAIEREQSNSTALVDQDYVVKLYRRIDYGPNPEIEMSHFLTEIAGFAHTPPLLGHLQAVQDDKIYALAVVHCFVPNRGDGWTFSADRIAIYLDAVGEGSEERDKALTERRDYMLWARRLGSRVAEMHQALASRPNVADFEPEPIDRADMERWMADISERAARIGARFRDGSDVFDNIEYGLVRRVASASERFPEFGRGLAKACVGGWKIRHHGDLHLGQVLVANDDVTIIDFEGEPSRPISERRLKAPAARDVAGVVRSLDYAAMAVVEQRRAEGKLTPAQSRALTAWRDHSTDAFLNGYFESIDQTRIWPENADDARTMLNFFLLEKALYEVEYELSYRPTWIGVPLRGVVRALNEFSEL